MSAWTVPWVSPLKRMTDSLVLVLVALVTVIWVVSAAYDALEDNATSVGSPRTFDYDGASSGYDRAANLADAVDTPLSNAGEAKPVARPTGPFLVQSARLSTPQTTRAAEAAGTAGRSASTEWGRAVQHFQRHGDEWTRVSAHAEQATGRAYRGGTSIEEIFRRGDDWLVRHRIYGSGDDVLHETFRPYAKFGQ